MTQQIIIEQTVNSTNSVLPYLFSEFLLIVLSSVVSTIYTYTIAKKFNMFEEIGVIGCFLSHVLNYIAFYSIFHFIIFHLIFL